MGPVRSKAEKGRDPLKDQESRETRRDGGGVQKVSMEEQDIRVSACRMYSQQ